MGILVNRENKKMLYILNARGMVAGGHFYRSFPIRRNLRVTSTAARTKTVTFQEPIDPLVWRPVKVMDTSGLAPAI